MLDYFFKRHQKCKLLPTTQRVGFPQNCNAKLHSTTRYGVVANFQAQTFKKLHEGLRSKFTKAKSTGRNYRTHAVLLSYNILIAKTNCLYAILVSNRRAKPLCFVSLFTRFVFCATIFIKYTGWANVLLHVAFT